VLGLQVCATITGSDSPYKDPCDYLGPPGNPSIKKEEEGTERERRKERHVS
jgi:hypothetical protein